MYKRRALALPALNIPLSSPSFCCSSTEHGPASRLPRDLVLPRTAPPPNHTRIAEPLRPHLHTFEVSTLSRVRNINPCSLPSPSLNTWLPTLHTWQSSPHTPHTLSRSSVWFWPCLPGLCHQDRHASHLPSYHPARHLWSLQHSNGKTILGWQLWLTPRGMVQQAPCDRLWSRQKYLSVRRISFFVLEDFGASLCAWVRHYVYSHWDCDVLHLL